MEKLTDKPLHSKEIPNEILPVLISLGRGLGTVSIYGTEHPGVEQILNKTFADLQVALRTRQSLSIGTFNGSLTVDDEPVSVLDVPVRMLERRLTAMQISHLALTKGLARDELKHLLKALCAQTGAQMKESLSESKMSHVKVSDVRYVALRDGEEMTGTSSGPNGPGGAASGPDTASSFKVSQIVAFLKGEASKTEASGDLKKMLSDPERLGQMIMEAANIRQSSVSIQDGESLADIVVGCLRRTYDGLRKESAFMTPQGKVNLAKGMMLLEKTVLDKIHAAFGDQHPDIDRRILNAIREMDEDHQFEMLTARYFDQRRKMERAEEKIIERIRKQGADKVREQFVPPDVPPADWQRLTVKAGSDTADGKGTGIGGGLDLSALAVVLEKLEGLMQIGGSDPAQIKTAVSVTRNGLNAYADRIESRIQDLEGQVKLRKHSSLTVEDHAAHLNREELMIEVSRLTMALLQPLTVVNASVEAAMRHAGTEPQKELLDLAFKSGKRIQSLTERLINLVGYPEL